MKYFSRHWGRVNLVFRKRADDRHEVTVSRVRGGRGVTGLCLGFRHSYIAIFMGPR